MKNKIEIKRELFKICSQNIEQRISTIENRLKLIEESRNNETKSSVGDKYETGRAMMQMEEEKSKIQLLEANRVRQDLLKIDTERNFEKGELGSLISTNRGEYYLSIGIGKVNLKDKLYYCISMDSPIGKKLRNRQKGEEIGFNNMKIRIEEVN